MFYKFKVFCLLSCLFLQNTSFAGNENYAVSLDEDTFMDSDCYMSAQTPRAVDDLEAAVSSQQRRKSSKKYLGVKNMAKVAVVSVLALGAVTGVVFIFQKSSEEDPTLIQRDFLRSETRSVLCDFREAACSSGCTVSCEHLSQEPARYSRCTDRLLQDKNENCHGLCFEQKEECLSAELPEIVSSLPIVPYDRKKEVLRCIGDKNVCIQACSSSCSAVLSYQGCNVSPGCHESCDATYIKCMVVDDNSPSERFGPEL